MLAVIGHVARKEFRQILRDRRSLVLILVMPIILTFLFGKALETGELRDIPSAILNLDGSPESNVIVTAFSTYDEVQIRARGGDRGGGPGSLGARQDQGGHHHSQGFHAADRGGRRRRSSSCCWTGRITARRPSSREWHSVSFSATTPSGLSGACGRAV